MTNRLQSATARRKLALIFAATLAVAVFLTGCAPGANFRPSGWSGLTGSDNLLFVAAGDGRVAALDKQDGKVLWMFPPNPKDKNARRPFAIYSAPAVSQDRVYVGDYAGTVFALNRTNGQEVWTYCIETNQTAQCAESSQASIVGDIVLKNGTLYVPSSNGTMYALDAGEGALGNRIKWAFATGDKVWSTPTISDDGVVYFGSLDHSVYAVSLDKGKQLWKYPTKGAIVGQSLVFKGMVYIGGLDRTLYALDAKNGAKKWEQSGDNWFWAGPVTNGATIFAATLGGSLMSLDPETGKLRWSVTTKAPIVTPIVPLQDSLVVATDDKYIRVFSADNGREVWPYPLDEKVRTKPVVSQQDGLVYIVDIHSKVRLLNAVRGTALWGPQSLPES